MKVYGVYDERERKIPVGHGECPRCNGKGWEYVPFGEDDVDMDLCPRCDGKGLISMIEVL